MLARSLLRWAAYGAGITAAATTALVASNHLLAPRSIRHVRTGFTLRPALPGADPKRLFVAFHGLWSGQERFGNLRGLLQAHGTLLLVSNGASIDDTVKATLSYLLEQDLLDRKLVPVGFSLGTQTAIEFMRHYQSSLGRDVQFVVLCSGMASQGDVIWPNPYLPHLVPFLKPGPVVGLGWQAYWRYRLRKAIAKHRAGGPADDIASAKWPLEFHQSTVLSGALQLIRGLRLQRNEFPATSALIFQHRTDPMVRECFAGWKSALPNSHSVIITKPGHGDFDGCYSEYATGFNTWFAMHPGL